MFHNKTRQTENVESIPQQLKEYFESQIKAPSESYFHETLEQHLSGLKPNETTFEEVRTLLLSSELQSGCAWCCWWGYPCHASINLQRC